MLTISPGRPAAINRRPSCWLRKKAPRRLLAMTASQSAQVTSTASLRRLLPALLTSRSTRPNTEATSAMARSMLDGEPRSSTRTTGCTPSASSCATVPSRFSARVADTATSKPRRASASAVAAPTPYEAPVTKAVFLSADLFILRDQQGPGASANNHRHGCDTRSARRSVAWPAFAQRAAPLWCNQQERQTEGVMSRTGLVAAALALSIAFGPSALAQTKVRVGQPQVGTFQFVPLQVGIEAGVFRKHKIDLEVISFGGGPRVQQP